MFQQQRRSGSGLNRTAPRQGATGALKALISRAGTPMDQAATVSGKLSEDLSANGPVRLLTQC